MRTFVTIMVLFALSAASLLLFSCRAQAAAWHEPAWQVDCPGQKDDQFVYKSGWFTYSSCYNELPVSIPFGCTWVQLDHDMLEETGICMTSTGQR